ncbi:MAG: SiaB family protein kinase [Bernardetiaceae bacterium]|jgi:hypothetical protein|nr:SiaB family protein kinase [Bernardetiaceae bacterium]
MLPESELTLFEYYNLTSHKNVIISYKGPVTDVIMSEISRDIRVKVGKDATAGRKVFAVFIELAQNILYYSAEKVKFADRNDGVGILLLTQSETAFTFSCGNLVENQHVEELVGGINLINSMDQEQLREYKRRQRGGPSPERSKGAGFGLTQVALTSGNPLQVDFKKIDDLFSFFSLSIKINKDSKPSTT